MIASDQHAENADAFNLASAILTDPRNGRTGHHFRCPAAAPGRRHWCCGRPGRVLPPTSLRGLFAGGGSSSELPSGGQVEMLSKEFFKLDDAEKSSDWLRDNVSSDRCDGIVANFYIDGSDMTRPQDCFDSNELKVGEILRRRRQLLFLPRRRGLEASRN